MEGRTVAEWDKNDIDALGILKVDVLALGMLSCIRRAFDLMVHTLFLPLAIPFWSTPGLHRDAGHGRVGKFQDAVIHTSIFQADVPVCDVGIPMKVA